MRAAVRITQYAAAVGFALSGASGAAACELPSMVEVPVGETATLEDMLGAQQAVKAYVDAVYEYLDCTDQQITAAGDDAPEEYRALMFNRYNAAVAEVEAVAAAFNEQREAFLAANPDQAAESSEP